MKKLALLSLAALLAPFATQAESNAVTGAGALAANARLDFAITIPKVLYLQVGSGTNFIDNALIDKILFDVPAANVGNSTPVAGTGGDLTAGRVTVRVRGNSGDVILTNNNTGPLSNGVLPAEATIPWSDITVTGGALAATTPGFTNAAITHPTFNLGAAGGASTAPTTLAATGRIVRREGTWTFAYANTATLPSGTYGDTLAKHGRVTYTATAP